MCGGLTAGSVYFLSGTDGASGEITTTEVGEAGKVRKPLVLGLGATAGYVLQYVGARVSAETDTAAPTMRRISFGSDGIGDTLSSGMSCGKDDDGVYTVTHNFGTNDYTVIATMFSADIGWVKISAKTSNTCEIKTYNESDTLEDRGCEVLLAKDVT